MLGSWVRAPYRSHSGNSIGKRNERTSFEVLFFGSPENRVIGFVLLPIRPAELGKTTNTTFTTSNNLRAVARIALLLQGKQQNTTLRQDITPGEISRKCVQGEALFIVVSIAASLMSAWASKRRCPREALYLVVKVVQVVFHVSTLHHSIFRKNLFFVDPMVRGI